MFSKPYKLKASNSLKSSVRKVLVQKLKETYPNVNDDDLKEIIPLKATLTSIKIVTHSEETVCVYAVDNVPCIIEINEVFYPTVFALWRCPHMIPAIVIESHLAGKLQGGIIHLRRSHLPPLGNRLPRFLKGATVSVCTANNKAPILVGTASYSSGEMLIVQTGITVRTLNIIGDYVCTYEKFTKVNRPELGLPVDIKENLKSTADISKDLSQLRIQADENCDPIKSGNEEIKLDMQDNSLNTQDTDVLACNDDVDDDDFLKDMDSLLKYCLLCFLKEHGKKATLPLKTNLLYANHMLTYCPPDKTLDVKKSSYKKMGKFLEAMQKEGLIQIKEVEKGVDAVVAINVAHELIKQHSVLECVVTVSDNDTMTYNPPSVRETFRITAAVVTLFSSSDWKKGHTVTSADVRTYLVDYVKKNNLQDPQSKILVKIDPYLGTFTSEITAISWEALMSAVLSKMTACTEITFPDGKIKTVNGKLSQITMQVAKRSGNKKVTIVSNLEEYGISLQTLSKECQHGVAASCTITKTAGSKTDQLQVQGNQTYFLAKHLTEVYGVPKKYIEGADKFLSKKKN